MTDISNYDRVGYAQQALELYPFNEDPDSAIVDLLANLMHYCQANSHDFEAELKTARMHFGAENEDEGENHD